MLSLSVMNATELEALKPSLGDANGKQRVAVAIEQFLRSHRMDGGADEDLIFLTGRALTKAGIWELLPPKFLAARVKGVDPEMLRHFLSLAPDYLSRVSQLLEAGNRELKKQQLRYKKRVHHGLLPLFAPGALSVTAAANGEVNAGRSLEMAARAMKRQMARKNQQRKFRGVIPVNALEEGEGAAYLDAHITQAVIMERSAKRVVERARSLLSDQTKAVRARKQSQSIRQK